MRRIRLTAAALMAAAILAACGDNGTGSGDTAPTTTAAEARPERIVSLSATATEMLFAIGAGDQVVAVDDQSDHPTDAPVTDLSGFEPNVEAIAGYEPDLVVLSNDISDVVAGLDQLDIEVLVQPAPPDLEGVYDQIVELGEVTGHAGEADELVEEMTAEIAELVDDLPETVEGMTYYHELDNTYYSITSGTFIGDAYAQVGLENIADAAEDTAGGYPQLSAEFIIEADPDLIFLADAEFGESPETVAGRPGWGDLTAVQNGAVFPVDADLASRWGPRVVDFIRSVAKQLSEFAEGTAG